MVKIFFIIASLVFGTLMQTYAQIQPNFSDEIINKSKADGNLEHVKSNTTILPVDIFIEHDVNQNILDKPNFIESNSLKPSINVYPNPVTSSLHVELTSGSKDKYTLLVTDQGGKILINQNFNGSSALIDMSHLPPSYYLIFLFNNEKLIKEGKILKI